MLPAWFDAQPWALLLEGGGLGMPYSYFVKFKRLKDGYEFYITDLCTIWWEKADQEGIKTKLKPFESFLELSMSDLLQVLEDMFAKESDIKVSLQPASEGNLKVETTTQLGFVKFSWPFQCAPIDYKTSAQHFRSKIVIPAVKAACEASLDSKSIMKAEWDAFTNKTTNPDSVTPSIAPSLAKTALPSQSTESLSHVEIQDSPSQTPAETKTTQPEATATQSPVKAPPSQSTQSTQKSNPEAELERRRQIEEMMKQKQAAADEKKKKRKLI